jgi:hypothetical protein
MAHLSDSGLKEISIEESAAGIEDRFLQLMQNRETDHQTQRP